MIFGISGNCGKNCPRFKNKSCEVYLDTLENEYDSDEKEIERLNNIINELEDLIVIKLQRDYHEHNYRISTGDLEEIYDKLQELKSGDKE